MDGTTKKRPKPKIRDQKGKKGTMDLMGKKKKEVFRCGGDVWINKKKKKNRRGNFSAGGLGERRERKENWEKSKTRGGRKRNKGGGS